MKVSSLHKEILSKRVVVNFDVPLVANEDEKEVMDFQVLVRGSGSMGSRYLQLFQDELGISPIVFPKRNERMVELTGQGFQVIKDLAELDRSSPVYSRLSRHTCIGRFPTVNIH